MSDISVDLKRPGLTGNLSVQALAGPKRRQRREAVIRGLFLLAALVSVVISILIVFSLIREASTFITDVEWSQVWGEAGWFPRRGLYDLPTILIASLIVTLVAMMVAGPLGLGAAIYLSEYASARTRSVLKPILEILAGVPSVVLGFFALFTISRHLIEPISRSAWLIIGYLVLAFNALLVAIWARQAFTATGTDTKWLVRRIAMAVAAGVALFVFFWWLNAVAADCSPVAGDVAACPSNIAFQVKRSGQLAAAAIGVGILTIPLVASVSEDALASVPRELREASAGLGARKATTVTQVVLPAAVSGIVAAFIIGISRALGETMVVFMAGGAADAATFTYSPFDGSLTMTAAMASLATGTDNVVGEGLTFQSLYFVGLLLFVLTLLLNIAAGRFVARVRERY